MLEPFMAKDKPKVSFLLMPLYNSLEPVILPVAHFNAVDMQEALDAQKRAGASPVGAAMADLVHAINFYKHPRSYSKWRLFGRRGSLDFDSEHLQNTRGGVAVLSSKIEDLKEKTMEAEDIRVRVGIGGISWELEFEAPRKVYLALSVEEFGRGLAVASDDSNKAFNHLLEFAPEVALEWLEGNLSITGMTNSLSVPELDVGTRAKLFSHEDRDFRQKAMTTLRRRKE